MPHESLDFEILLYPFEEQFHLPSALVQLSDLQCTQLKQVGEKYDVSVVLEVMKLDPSERHRIVVFSVLACQYDVLIALHAEPPISRRLLH